MTEHAGPQRGQRAEAAAVSAGRAIAEPAGASRGPGLEGVIGNQAFGALARAGAAEAPPPWFRTSVGPGRRLPPTVRARMEAYFKQNFGGVRLHTDAGAATSAGARDASAYAVGDHVAFAKDRFRPDSRAGQRLLAHELAHVVQQRTGGAVRGTVQCAVSPEDVSPEMVGKTFAATEAFTARGVKVDVGNHVKVDTWVNTSDTARVHKPAPYLDANIPFDIPKRILRPAESGPVAGVARYSADVAGQAATVTKGEQAIEAEKTRKGGPLPGEVARLETLQRSRQKLLNRKLIQETMFNRFDAVIKKSVDSYDTKFKAKGFGTLDPNLVKSMLFQESQLGTSGTHLEVPPSHPTKSRFNLGQVIDSSGAALLIMMREEEPALIATYDLQNIDTDRAAAQAELARLEAVPTPTAAQATRLAELRRLSRQFWEVFTWGYRAAGKPKGFADAAEDFFDRGAGIPRRNLDYEFWIQAAIRWLYEKRAGVSTWEEAVRAYNGSGQRAKDYKDAVTRRATEAKTKQTAGDTLVPSGI